MLPYRLRKRFYPLPTFATALRQQETGAGRCIIGFSGDSTFGGAFAAGSIWTNNRQYSMADLVATELQTRGVQVNTNNIFTDNVTANNATSLPYDPRVTMSSGWALIDGTSGVPPRNYAISGNVFRNSTNANRIQFTPTVAFDTIEVWYTQFSGGGLLDIAVDGGSKIGASVDTNGSTAVGKATRTTTLGTHTVEIFKDVAADSKFIYLSAINCYDSTAPKVECWNWGGSGFYSVDWAETASPYSPGNAISTFAPHLGILNLTVNDAGNSTSVATYKTRMQSIINAFKTNGDLILCSGTPAGGTSEATYDANQPGLVRAAKELAYDNKLNFLDFYTPWVSPDFANAQGNMAVDLVHPVARGYKFMASQLATFLSQATVL